MAASMERMTTAQAIVRYLSQQYIERDGVEQRLFAGMFGIFGHGNVTGIGQALEEVGARPALSTARRTSRRWSTPRWPTRR